MQDEEEDKSERDPEPGDFDEEDVEEVAFAGEVAGSGGGRVRLRDGIVRGVTGGRVDEGEDGAEEEGGWVGG